MNKYKYYLFYRKDTGDLYAYTDQKIHAKGFKKTRNMDLFVSKESMFTSQDLRDLHENVAEHRIILYDFKPTSNVVLPITLCEQLTLEHTVVQILNVDIYCQSSIIPYEIFTKEMQEYLKIVGYIDSSNEYRSGTYKKSSPKVKSDYLTCFLSLYGDTMKQRW